MRNALLKHLVEGALKTTRFRSATAPSLPFAFSSKRHAVSASLAGEETETIEFPREGPGFFYGLNWALAGRGVIVKEKAFHNLKSSELQQKGAIVTERLSGLPIHIRGSNVGGAAEISKAQFSKLLKQVSTMGFKDGLLHKTDGGSKVTSHISSISNVFVHDGAVGSSSECDAKVRVICDNPSAALSLSNVLWGTPTRAISHDSCPLTIYVATSLSPSTGEAIGIKSQADIGFLAADIERSSLILCGKAFADTDAIKDVLAALAAPVISARGGLPLSARILVSGDSVILLFAPEDTIQTCSDLRQALVSLDAGVVLSSHGVAPLFRTRDSSAPNLFKMPASLIILSSDSSGALPSISKLSPGQAAYHFLAGYQNGNFVSAYIKGSSPLNPVELAKALLSQLKDNEIPSFLLNVSGGKQETGKELVKLMESTLSKSIPPLEPKVGELQGKYTSFLSGKYQDLPEEFSF